MTVKRSSLFLFLILFPFYLLAQDTLRGDTTLRKKAFVNDDPVVAMLDSLANLKVFENTMFLNPASNQTPPAYSDYDVPTFPDSVYRERITNMSMQSPFEYVYNTDVRKFIDLYAYRKRGLTARILGLAQIYFPMFEEQLDKYNMPLELKYLAVIESALNPTANSRAGAKGLWQFIYGTGKVYGLKISSYVDDRYDPMKSTVAACEHLTDLYDIYDNWSLALAAYNSGAGNVNKAIRRSGGAKNFWVIQKYLPKETRSYVPAFIAASYVMQYAPEHHIYPVDPGLLFYEIDTVTVKSPLTFDQISEMLSIPMEELQFLNPCFKQGVIPATWDNPYQLRLRKKYIGDFINNETALYAFKTKKGMEHDSLLALAYANSRETTEYRVKSGETMAGIARKFHMTTSELKSLNGLKKNYVKPKQRLLVYTGPPKTRPPDKISPTAQANNDSIVKQEKEIITEKDVTVKTHTVKRGENLSIIAQNYSVSTADLIKWNHLNGATVMIGQKLKLAPPENGTAEKKETASKSSKQSKPATASNGQKYIYYTIQSGDNLWGIAEKFDGATVAQIKKLNNITNAQKLQPGQKIKIMPAN
jgi:membrane-bound lytic murein transglycosylase D